MEENGNLSPRPSERGGGGEANSPSICCRQGESISTLVLVFPSLGTGDLLCPPKVCIRPTVHSSHTLPPKSLHTPISVCAIKHACYLGLGVGQGEGRHLCKLGAFLKKTIKYI